MKHFLCFFLLLLGTLSAWGEETKHVLKVKDKEGDYHRIYAYSYMNALNRQEVRLEATAFPEIIKGINPIIGFGRDLDDDGRVETWFMYNTRNGFVRYTTHPQHPLGFDAIENDLFRYYSTSADMYANVIATAIFSYLTITVAKTHESQIEYYKEIMDLEEMTLRYQRGMSMNISKMAPYQSEQIRHFLIDAHRRTEEKLDKAMGRDFVLLGAVDIVLWLTGAKVIQYFGKGMAVVGRTLVNTPLGRVVIKNIGTVLAHRKVQLSASKSLLMRGMTRITAPLAASRLSSLIFKKRFNILGKGLIARSLLVKQVSKISQKAFKGSIGHIRQWRYTLISLGTGFAYNLAHADVNEEPESLVKDLLEQREVQERIIQTSCPVAKGNKVTTQVLGFVDIRTGEVLAFNSRTMTRYSLNTGMEITNTVMGANLHQNHVENAALNFIEGLSVGNQRAGGKLLGYVVVVTINLAPNLLDEHLKKEKLTLVPMMVSQ